MGKKKSKKVEVEPQKVEEVQQVTEEPVEDMKEDPAPQPGVVSIRLNLNKLNPKTIWWNFQNLEKKKKIVVVSAGVVVLALILLVPLTFLLKLDSIVFPSKLSGTIAQSGGDPVEDAKVCVGNVCDNTDELGVYYLEGLTYGDRKIKIQVDGFQTLEETVELIRGENLKSFELKVEGVKDIAGILTVKDGELIVANFKLVVGDELYELEVEATGEFLIKDIAMSDLTIRIASPNYKDKSYKVNPAEAQIDIGEIVLIPAGDLQFSPVDWLSLEFIDDVEVSSQIEEEELRLSLEGENIVIRDLDLGQSVTANVEKDGYVIKQVGAEKIEQGLLDLGNLGMVKEGKVVYVSSRTGNKNIYVANYDGSEEKMLSGDKGDSYAPYYNAQEGSVTFLSERGGDKDDEGNLISLVYKVSIFSGQITKVSKNEYEDNDNFIGVYNLKAGKRLYSEEHPDYPDTDRVMFGDMNSSGMKQIFHTADNLYDFKISDDGKYVMYKGYYSDSSKNGVYLYNTHNAAQDRIYENEDNEYLDAFTFSPDSKSAIFRIQSGGQIDLFVRNFTTGKTTQLTSNSVSEFWATFNSNSSKVSFITTRDGRSDIYTIELDGKNEKKITNDGKVDRYFWLGDLLFYTSEDKLMVIDSKSPEETQQVSGNAQVSAYTSYWLDGYGYW